MPLLCINLQKSLCIEKSHQATHWCQRVRNYTFHFIHWSLFGYFIHFFLCIFYLIENRFPCKVENCTKEYRTQWELNNHQRLKHITSEINCQFASASSSTAQQKLLSSSATENTNHYRMKNDPSNERTVEAEQCIKSNNDENIIYLLADDIVSVVSDSRNFFQII